MNKFAQPSYYELQKPALEDAQTLVQNWQFSGKVSLMLDNPFLVPSFCKLNHISLYFIQISTKSVYSLQGKQCFFWSHPRCFGPLGKFQHNIKISIKTARVSRLSVSCDYGLMRLRCRNSGDLVTILICEHEKMSNLAWKKPAKWRLSTAKNQCYW